MFSAALRAIAEGAGESAYDFIMQGLHWHFWGTHGKASCVIVSPRIVPTGEKMDAIQAIEARRSIKHYDPDHRMSEEEEKQLLSLAMLSPTAFNIQNWRFVVVKDAELRKEIRTAAWDQAQVTDASLLIVLCADLKAWKKSPERYWVNAPQEVQDILVPALTPYYSGNEQVQRDEAMRSCGIAAQTLMVAAKSMGYDSCPMDGFDFEKVGELIQLPEDHVVTMFVVVGKGIKDAWPRPGQIGMEEVVIQDRFGS